MWATHDYGMILLESLFLAELSAPVAAHNAPHSHKSNSLKNEELAAGCNTCLYTAVQNTTSGYHTADEAGQWMWFTFGEQSNDDIVHIASLHFSRECFTACRTPIYVHGS